MSFIYRFGVGDLQSLHSSVWRVWSPRHKSDIYLATRGTADRAKVSIHESGVRSYSLTSQRELQLRKDGRWRLPSRHLERWRGGRQVNPELSLEYRLIFPTAELRHFEMPERETAEVMWLPPADIYNALEIVAKDMTPAQIADAQRMAREWLAAHGMGGQQ